MLTNAVEADSYNRNVDGKGANIYDTYFHIRNSSLIVGHRHRKAGMAIAG